MKTLSLIFAALLVAFAVTLIFRHNMAGLPLLLIGGLSYIIIAWPTKKIRGYDRRHWMNR